MANWVGATRSNYFHVKDAAAFRAAMEAIEVEVASAANDDGDDAVMVRSNTDEGDWPSTRFDEQDNDIEVDMVTEIAPHLLEGEVVVLMQSGHEGIRYVDGHAMAFTSKAEPVAVDLGEIYQRAKRAFGIEPTEAEY